MPISAEAPPTPRLLVVHHPVLEIEGHQLADATLSGCAYGPELGTAPVMVLVGGITASPFPFGREGESGPDAWWPALQSSDLVNLSRTTVLCPAWPGNGSTWRGFEGPDALPPISVLGLADLVAAWLTGCGCSMPIVFLGASLGGIVGVAFAVRHPERCRRLIVISASLRPDGWGTATRHLQRALVRDGLRNDDPGTGMNRARQLGMLTYRGRDELDTRFERLVPGLDRRPVADYLEHHGRRFAERFPIRTFLLLSEAIDRGSIAADAQALRAAFTHVTAEATVVGVPGDMLFPWPLQVELHRQLQAAGARSPLWKLDSPFGHDAFLADQERLADLLRRARAFGTDDAATPQARVDSAGEPVRELRLGLVSCGTVGTALLQMIERQEQAVVDRYGVRIVVTRIAVRDRSRPRTSPADSIPITSDALNLVSDPDVDVVVELAGGLAMEPVLRAALASGKPVVTANKVLLASKLADLGVLAQRTGTPLYCEAAAAAAADEIDSLAGILNGTCNFALTRMEQSDCSLEEAVGVAQALGLTEADPGAELDGLDVAAKLSVLAYRAFGVRTHPDRLPVRGIRDIGPHDCGLAAAMGCRIRLIALAARVRDSLDVAVEPLLLPSWHLLASVEEEYNAVYLRCASSGDISLFGKGASAMPTATAVLGDLIDVAQGNSVRWPAPLDVPLASRDGSAPARPHYLRVTADEHDGLEPRIESLMRRHGLTTRNRATRTGSSSRHLGVLTSPARPEALGALCAAVSGPAGVHATLSLGVFE